MSPHLKLKAVYGLITLITVYTLIIAIAPHVALYGMVGYCGVILTIFAFDSWSKHHE